MYLRMNILYITEYRSKYIVIYLNKSFYQLNNVVKYTLVRQNEIVIYLQFLIKIT